MPDQPEFGQPASTREALGPQPFGAVGDLVAKALLGADPEHSSMFYRALRALAGSPVEPPAFQPAVVTGPGRGWLQANLPPQMFKALEQHPATVAVRAASNWNPEDALAYTSLLRSPVGSREAPWTSTSYVPYSSSVRRAAMTEHPEAAIAISLHSAADPVPSVPVAIHEALHTLYRLKSLGQSGFPQPSAIDDVAYWRMLADKSLQSGALSPSRHTQLYAKIPQEAAIEALTANILSRSPSQMPQVMSAFNMEPPIGVGALRQALRMMQASPPAP